MKWKRGTTYGLLKTEVLNGDDQVIATVQTRRFRPGVAKHGETVPWPEGERHLALILAAPALLDALEKIVNHWDDLHPKDRQQARAAIATVQTKKFRPGAASQGSVSPWLEGEASLALILTAPALLDACEMARGYIDSVIEYQETRGKAVAEDTHGGKQLPKTRLNFTPCLKKPFLGRKGKDHDQKNGWQAQIE